MKNLNRSVQRLVLFACAFACTHAYAATFCATSQTSIQTALTTAASNGEADEIRIAAGTYTMTGVSPVYNRVALALESAEAYPLTISGGWNTNCSIKTYDQTELNGDSKYPILFLESDKAMAITVTDLSFVQAGYSAVTGIVDGAALYITTKANIVIERDQFIENRSNHSGAVFAVSSNADAVLLLRNNLFFGNQAVYVGGAYLKFPGGGIVAGNTFVGNGASDMAGTGGAFLDSASGAFLVANNIFYAGTGVDDLELSATSAAPDTLMNNDIDVLSGGPQSASSACNFDLNPGFAPGLLSVHLAPSSPLVNAGSVGEPGVLGEFDLDAAPRVTGAHADIGALETDVISRDGFETRPDLCAAAN